jgi:hypothetical protein
MRVLAVSTCLFLLLGADVSLAQRTRAGPGVSLTETDRLTRAQQFRASAPLSTSGRFQPEQMYRGGSLYSLMGNGLVVAKRAHRHIQSVLWAVKFGSGGRRTFGVRSDRWLHDFGVSTETVALWSFPRTFSSCYSSPIAASDSLGAGAGPWGKLERIVLGSSALLLGAVGLGLGVWAGVLAYSSVDDLDTGFGAMAFGLFTGMSLIVGAGGVWFIVQGVRLLQGKDLWIPGESGGDPPPPPPLPSHASSRPSLFQLSFSL